MALDEADRRLLDDIERRLRQEDPRLARRLAREPSRLPRLQGRPVLGAVVVLLTAFGWLAASTGSAVPVLLVLPPAAAAVGVLLWQRTDRPPDPARRPARHDTPEGQPYDGSSPPWWLT